MTIVRFIFMLVTMPVKIRPRMLTFPVKGHFLSIYVPSMACWRNSHRQYLTVSAASSQAEQDSYKLQSNLQMQPPLIGNHSSKNTKVFSSSWTSCQMTTSCNASDRKPFLGHMILYFCIVFNLLQTTSQSMVWSLFTACATCTLQRIYMSKEL